MINAPWKKLHMPKELACEFLGVFFRFEYALKAAKFAQSPSGYAKPDWKEFGKDISDKFDAHASSELADSVGYLEANPPLRQTYDEATGLDWGPVRFDNNPLLAEKLIAWVCCVRNNLFHGGKFLAAPADSPDRDRQLVLCSLIVLDALVVLNDKVYQAFVS